MEAICIICDKELGDFGRFEHFELATIFSASGNYGSGLWDPPNSGWWGYGGQQLRIYICDDCLRARAAKVTLVRNVSPTPEYEMSPWDPDKDPDVRD